MNVIKTIKSWITSKLKSRRKTFSTMTPALRTSSYIKRYKLYNVHRLEIKFWLFSINHQQKRKNQSRNQQISAWQSSHGDIGKDRMVAIGVSSSIVIQEPKSARWTQTSITCNRTVECPMSLHDSRSPCLSRMLRLSWVVFSLFLPLASANTAPQFNMSSTFRLPEDTPIGTWVFQLVAVDAENDSLYYSIEGENAYYFSADSRTGNVTLKQPVDYEQTKAILLNAKVSDYNSISTFKKITIIVEDRNDNKPIFQNEPYMTDVLENTKNGTPIYNVRAVDIDSEDAGWVSYKIEEVIPNNAENHQLFIILQNGTVVLNGSLSYNNKSTFYRIKIFATDNGGKWHGSVIYHNNTAYLSVAVIDVADLDPQFLGEPYMASVSENCPLGTSVMTVLAIDKDKDVNDIILYSIINASSLFTVNQSTGVITVNSNLDREGVPGEEVQFQIVAREKNLNIYHQVAEVSTQVTIHITDINDNKPQFYLCTDPPCNFTGPTEVNFSGQIEEHASARTPVANLSIVAYDPDKGQNGTFQLFLRGPDALAFSVSPRQIVNEGTVQVLVRNSSLVDYETITIMTVEIVANDTRRTVDCCSFATVTIHLLDVNDHRPEFRQTDYKLSVLEESPPGFIVASNITATDPDSGKFGEITYQLLPKSIQSDFTVNEMNGTIFVANGSKINWGIRPTYYATLQAMDGAGLIGSTQLEIAVIDINNNPPVVTGFYNFMVIEGKSIEPIWIQATDQDNQETNNSRLHFEIMPGNFSNNFTINPDSGELVSKGPLDREAIPVELNGKIVVTVLVQDLGIPQLNDTVNVTFTVEDKNDNAPSFNSSNYEFSISEGLQGAFVGVVEARDADQTEIHNRISFYINSSIGSNNFLIRSSAKGSGWYQGTLYLDIALDYDQMQEKFFNLILRAENSDFGERVEVAIAMVRVYVLDVNDESPTILPSPLESIHVTENEKLHQLVAVLEATDKDTNHSLVFQELATACFNSAGSAGNICQHWFHLSANGSLFVNSSDIDYELCTQVEITLRVKDEFTAVGNPYSRNETLVILIGDANDNAPQFLPVDDTFVIIPEISPRDLPVAVVKAKDADSDENGVITFSISEVVFIEDNGGEQKFSEVFKVAKTIEKGISVGSIQIASNLNSALKGRYQVKVEAKDNGTQALSNFTSLDIFSVDRSYRIKLKFDNSLKKVESNSNEIKRILSKATESTVYIAAIYADDSSTSKSDRALEHTVMDAYFVYKNGTALTDEQVLMLIRRNPEELQSLTAHGLLVIGPADVKEPEKGMELFGIIIGLAAAVFVLLLLLIGTVIGMRKSYTRKLKALKALKVASHFSANGVQQGPAIPGTNKYNTEGANPVLGFSLDPSVNLGFEENASSEVASLNSLDENMVDASHDSFPAKLKLDKADAQWEINHLEEPLKAALDSHRKNKPLQQGDSKKVSLDFGNSSLDTTEM
ncbi:cadherin-related family member 2 isoform X2 [Crotalus tigris]|uniref:cadherin-related family member 2 isoform X2 n=1 Tax=Crotalus tigris TaxID=88082 RepID=UPI00192F8E20|nr:cadherin-related family member 2 isoform X2 [Crotalus tigris]XP_039212650.1 cadherin-related family member 2 isoform X2 [Crotalus tigris]XP_039212651.1 cadherin-related family member 2 isoform X2 [Crotalus tigris]XP_039212652.1 cadherin-related family member 2 isoform X2 [Crotalus tigris]XP_039212654.1 cadherin-related family member 2 isoform X2 [Crotalus tigris]XP_039212655.1 cadherin-related family member 2 isoform X2 [Crotalus tigris]XP_039212656.1 cadherin-related family member 2 isofo